MRNPWRCLILVGFVWGKGNSEYRCLPFNYAHYFCYEKWLPDDMAKQHYIQNIDNSNYQIDFWLKSSIKNNVMSFAFEFHNDRLLRLMSQMPDKETENEYIANFINTYIELLSYTPTFYSLAKIREKFGKSWRTNPNLESYVTSNPVIINNELKNYKLFLNFCTDDGHLQKSIDVIKFGLAYLKEHPELRTDPSLSQIPNTSEDTNTVNSDTLNSQND